MNWSKKFTITILLAIFHFSADGQELEKKPLFEVLKMLESKFEVSFTYADENIRDVLIFIPNGMGLEQTLRYLNNNLSLTFTRLDSRYITISKEAPTQRTICGYMVESMQNQPLFATIQAISDTSTMNFTTTDASGYFEFKVPVGSDIIIKSLGYQTITVSENNFSSCITLPMQEQAFKLEEVVVQSFITQGINKVKNGSFIIDTKELGILPGLIEQDVFLTIQALPGIQSVNERVADLNVRGGTNDQNLILWDGIRMYQTGHFFGLISAFNPYLTEKVNLIKNGTPAKLTNGISSTIDIRSNNQVDQEFNGGIGINLINADLFLNVPLGKKASVQVSGRRSISDLIQTLTYQQYFERVFGNTEVTNALNDGGTEVNTNNEQFRFRDVSFKFIIEPSQKDKITLNLLQNENNISFEENAEIGGVIESRTSSLDQDNLSAGLSYSRIVNDKLKLNGFTYFSGYNLKAVNFDVLNAQRLIQENEVIDTGLELDMIYSFTSDIILNTGYQFYEIGIGNLEDLNNPEFRRYIKRVMRTHVGFADMEFNSKNGKFQTNLGIRSNYYEKLKELTFEPRLSITQKLGQYLSMGIMGEMKSQSTSQIIDLQNDFLGVEKRRWILADGADIPLLENQQVSMNLDFQNKSGLLVSMEAYYKDVTGLTTQSQGFQNQFQFIKSQGGYNSTGIDFLINYQYKTFRSWFTYSLAENTYTFEELSPPEFPSNLDIQHSFGLAASIEINKIEFSTGFKWHSGIPLTIPVEGNEIIDGKINYDLPNKENLDNYARLDLSAKYTLELAKQKSLQFGISIWNLLDRENVVNQYFVLNEADQLETIQQTSLGITPNVSIRFNFN